MSYPLVNRTHFSILQAFTKPAGLVEACVERGYKTVGLCDYANVSAAVEFSEACVKHKIKPILGSQLGDDYVFARNFAGWKKLIGLITKYVGASDSPYEREELDSDDLVIVGHDQISTNFFFTENVPITNSHYLTPSDKEIFDILRALRLKCKMKDISESPDLHLPLAIEDNTILSEIADLIEPYTILSAPKLPHFKSGEESEIQLLKKLVYEGWRKFAVDISKEKYPVYLDRIKKELQVIERGGLEGYFLIVRDFVSKFRDDKKLIGPGRGSAAGSLVSRLLRITLVDPIKHDLIFSRFYNSARSYPDHLSFDEYGFIEVFRDVDI